MQKLQKINTNHLLGRVESGRSNWVKVDGPGPKWTVQNTKFTIQNMKVDGRQRMKLDGTQSAWVVKKESGESGRSQNESERFQNAWVVKKGESGRSEYIYMVKNDGNGRFKRMLLQVG